ncbi:MAG: hypothetical protein KA792_04805 [Bacteroidales bacterium]|nr:hypothetical protein [Bacteroidales bacterium]
MKRTILHILLTVLIIAVFIIIYSFINKEKDSPCLMKKEIIINNSDSVKFVTEEDIKRLIQRLCKEGEGKKTAEQELSEIEKGIIEIPWVLSAKVYTTNKENLKIIINQRIPILRVINKMGENYYIDKQGMIMPICTKHSVRTIIAQGEIYIPYREKNSLINNKKNSPIDTNKLTVLQKLFVLANTIQKTATLETMTDQIIVNKMNDFEMIMQPNNQTIRIGDITNINAKLEKLLNFYKSEYNKFNWTKYKSINLKYSNQIVCSKI